MSRTRGFPVRRLAGFLALLSLATLGACQADTDRPATASPGDSPPGAAARLATGTAGMVSSAHPHATRAGLRILEAGGNAFDAAVAVAAALNVVEPMMSGIGGYGTILVYDAGTGESRFLNPSGRIPLGLESDVFRPPTPNYMENRRGAKSVSTPGNVNAWAALAEHGRLPWEQLFEEAIRLADEGYIIDERIALFIGASFDEFPEHAPAFDSAPAASRWMPANGWCRKTSPDRCG
ncbi:MAG: gamma-glutamyltransferase [Woeseiaceae bacterium]|nr:gamma-glutamyltransferase [Woeseiaceae bacterium]